MKTDRILHYSHFLILSVMLISGLILIFLFRGLPDRQYTVVTVTAFLYFLWGCLYHFFKGDFHIKIMVEYLLITVMAALLLRGAMYR
jgi:hypothetical protein